MFASVTLVLALAADPAHALERRLDEIAAINGRLRAVAVLVSEGRLKEASEAAAGLPEPSHREGGGALRVPGGGARCRSGPCLAHLAEWLLTHAGHAELSVEFFERAVAAGWKLTSDQRARLLDAYVESGQYQKAVVHARERAIAGSRIRLLEELASGKHEPLEALRQLGLGSLSNRLQHVLDIGRYSPRDAAERLAKLRLLKERGVLGVGVLAAEALVSDPDVPPVEAQGQTAGLAAGALRTGRFDDAVAYWDVLLARHSETTVKAWARLGQGTARRRQGRLTDAVKLLREAAALGEPAALFAEWELGHALLASGDGVGALAAYGRAREYRFPVCCQWGERPLLFHLYAGLSLERSGHTREAVEHYLRGARSFPLWWRVTLAGRLADLYGSAGALGVLEAMLETPAAPPANFVSTSWSGRLSGLTVVRAAVELRRLEDEKQWDALASALPARLAGAGPEDRRVRIRDWRAVEAARLLARHPEALPVLRTRLVTGPEGREPVWVFYALGLMGTREAVALLVEQATRSNKLHERHLMTVFYALGLTSRGRTALQELVGREATFARTLEVLTGWVAFDQMEGQATFEFEPEFPFPGRPSKLDLPQEMPPPLPAPRLRSPGINCLCS